MSPLLSIADARAAVRDAVVPLEVELVAVGDALDRVLAEDVLAAGDVPAFANSAMDGFAVRSGPGGRTLRVAGDSRAGEPYAGTVGEDEAVRISTGAVLPEGADAILQVELVTVDGDRVTLSEDVQPGRNVRGPGEDMRAGMRVLARGTRLGPAELGVAVGAGRGAVRVARRPVVAIVSTGDELVAPGAPLGRGQIHNSNALTLTGVARRTGGAVRAVTGAADSFEATREALAGALTSADVVLVSGGVSVGPHDHVKGALESLGVTERFWRVALRPGKPTWFGTRGAQLVFGLPGNPVSSMVAFHLFARPALLAQQGAPFSSGPVRPARLTETVPRNPGRDEAVRVRLAPGADGMLEATPTGPQGSHVLTSMLGADGLALVLAGDGDVEAGSSVDVELL